MKIEEPTERQKQLIRQDDFKDMTTGFVLLTTFGLMIVAALILGWEMLRWFGSGVWPGLTWADGFDWMGWGYPHIQAIGGQRIIDWSMRQALWSLPIIAGGTFCGVWLIWADNVSEETQQAKATAATWKRFQDAKNNPWPP